MIRRFVRQIFWCYAMMIHAIGWVDYYTCFHGRLGSYADTAASYALQSKGTVLGAFKGKVPVGLACCHGGELLFAGVISEFQGQGAASALIRACAEAVRQKGGRELTARSTGNAGLLLKCGFQQTKTSRVFRCELSRENCLRWQKLRKERLQKVNERLRCSEYEVIPFAQRRPQAGPGFPAELNPRFYDAPEERRLDALSFAAWREGKMVSFITVAAAGSDALVIRQLAARDDCRGTGVFLLPLEAAADAILQSGLRRLGFTVFDDNRQMNRLVGNFVSPFVKESCEQAFYQFSL